MPYACDVVFVDFVITYFVATAFGEIKINIHV